MVWKKDYAFVRPVQISTTLSPWVWSSNSFGSFPQFFTYHCIYVWFHKFPRYMSCSEYWVGFSSSSWLSYVNNLISVRRPPRRCVSIKRWINPLYITFFIFINSNKRSVTSIRNKCYFWTVGRPRMRSISSSWMKEFFWFTFTVNRRYPYLPFLDICNLGEK